MMDETIRNMLCGYGVLLGVAAVTTLLALYRIADAIDRHADVMRGIRDDDIDH